MPISDSRSDVLCVRFELDRACYCICLNDWSEFQLQLLPLSMTVMLCKCCVTLVPSYVSVCCPRGGAVGKSMSQLRSRSFKALLYLSS